MAANNSDGSDTYHEVPASQYWYLGDTIGAVPKGFFKYFTVTVIVATAATTTIACLTDWWQLLFIKLLTFFYIQNPIIGFPATIITCAIGYFYYTHRQKNHKKRQAENLRVRKYQDAVIAQHGGEKKQ
jgi:hypothetical protein